LVIGLPIVAEVTIEQDRVEPLRNQKGVGRIRNTLDGESLAAQCTAQGLSHQEDIVHDQDPCGDRRRACVNAVTSESCDSSRPSTDSTGMGIQSRLRVVRWKGAVDVVLGHGAFWTTQQAFPGAHPGNT
jgi:hypothetical protein